jgi:hypothetical protein
MGEDGNSLKIWKSAGYDIPYIPYTYKHVFDAEMAYWNPYKVHRFIVDYWNLSFLIVILYVFVSLKDIYSNKCILVDTCLTGPYAFLQAIQVEWSAVCMECSFSYL